MAVGQHDRLGVVVLEAVQPVFATVDHYPLPPIFHQRGGMSPMSIGGGVDVAASAEEGEFHGGGSRAR